MTQRTRRFARSLSSSSPQLRMRPTRSTAPSRAVLSRAALSRAALSRAAALRSTALLVLLGVAASAALLVPGRASAVCAPDPPMDDDTVVCTDEVSTGYDVSGAENLDISVEGNSVFDDTGAGLDSAIRIGQETSIAIGEDSIINVTLDNQFGIQGDNNNFIDNGGTISIDGENGRGVKIDDNTTGVLPNGAVNGLTGQIFANGDGSIAMETGTNSGVATSGLIELVGDDTRGISAGSREDLSAAANITNNGILNVGGDDGFGIIAGDDWIDGTLNFGNFTPQRAGIRNFQTPTTMSGGEINVTGDRSFGIFAGDDANTIGNHNSFVINGAGALINVTGIDSIGVSVGGNDYLDADNNLFGNVYTFQNQGLISGSADAGPLVQIRSFFSGFQNRIRNTETGEISADTTNLGTAGRGMAIAGSDGDDEISNLGDITGDVALGLGNDTYIHGVDATFQGTISLGDGDNIFENEGNFDQAVTFGSGADTAFNAGTFEGDFEVGLGADLVINGGDIDGDIVLGGGDDTYRLGPDGTVSGMILGGDGEDVVELFRNLSAPTRTFDLNQTQDFETVRLTGASNPAFDAGWDLLGTESFTGLTEVLDGAVLNLDDARTFAGDLTIAPNGNLVLSVDGVTTPLTVAGATTVTDGVVQLNIEDGAAPAEGSRILIIDAAGGLNGEFSTITFNTGAVQGVFAALYEDNAFLITFDPSLAAITRGQSQRSIAQNLTDINTAGTGTGEFQSFIDALFTLNQGGSTDITSVLNGLSPEGYDAHTTVSVEAGRQITRLLMDRPRECEPGQLDRFQGSDTPLPCHARRFSPWVATVGSFRSRDSFDNRPSYDAQVGGLVFGIDARPIGDLDLTIAIGSQYGSIDVGGFGSSSVTMTDLSAHVAWTPDSLRLQAVASWGHGFHENRRRVRADLGDIIPTVNQSVDSDHDSDRATLAVEAGYLFDLGPVLIEPLVGIDWAWINQRTIDEEEAPLGLALTIPGREDEVGSITAGMRIATEYRHDRYIGSRLLWMDGAWRPSLDVRWRQFLEGDERDFNARFDGTPSANSSFNVSSEEDPGGVELGVGLSFTPDLADRLQFDLRYEAYLSENTVQQDLVGRISLGF